MTRLALGALGALVACSSPAEPVHPTTTAAAQLSLAADSMMIAVPAGQYIRGSTPEEREAAYDDYTATAGKDTARARKWFDGEDDRQVAQLVAFRMDLMPVTQAQYAEIVTAGLAPAPAIDEAAWKATGFTQDYATQVARFVWHDGRPPPGREEHPVVLVSWTEADRYCKWRGEQRGERRRLPTAEEYEKATRGAEGLAYPWGNSYEAERINSAVQGPGDTTPVGAYAKGASPYGMLDLVGNVFEWTATPFVDHEMTVKGAAWDDFGGVGRGASRHGRPIDVRHVIIGFRCAADA